MSRAPKWHAEQMAAQQAIACPDVWARLATANSHYIMPSKAHHYNNKLDKYLSRKHLDNIKQNDASLVVGVMYRPPSSKVEYFNNMLDQLDHVYSNYDNVILLGDLNYNSVRGVDIVKRLKWMNVIQRQDYFMSLSVFKCIHGMSPFYLSDCITMCSEVATRNTRASTSHNILMVP